MSGMFQPAEIPDHLKDGWKAFIEWANAMERAGEPLPPGGVFLLTRNQILKGCLIRLRMSICAELEMSPNCVRIDIKRNDLGGLEPHVDVTPPDGWMKGSGNCFQNGNTSPDEFAKTHIEGVLKRCYQVFKDDCGERLESLDAFSRPDLEIAEIEDLLGESQKKDGDRGGG